MLDELKHIRELLTPKPEPPPPKPKNLADEFVAFLKKYKVMGLAVAFIMAIYLGALVQGLVDAFILPLIEFALPAGIGWESFTLGPFRIGTFLSAFITFIIVAFVIFLLVKVTSRFGIE